VKKPLLNPLPVRAGLAEYRNQANRLSDAWHAEDAEAVRCLRQHHPRLPGRANTNDRNAISVKDIRAVKVNPDDSLCVVARWHGFPEWSKLVNHVDSLADKNSPVLQFELAVEAVIGGNTASLSSALRKNHELVHLRSTREHGATLLHYVAANGVEGYRQKTPKNVVRIANMLIEAGSYIDADLDYGAAGFEVYPERIGSTTLGLAATSIHPALAGVQIPLLETLVDSGASVDGLLEGWNPVLAALHNGRGEAAEYLANRGARLTFEAAAGVGWLGLMREFFKKDVQPPRHELGLGFAWACAYGRSNVVVFLLRQGVNIRAMPHGETGLHWAAYGGHAGIVESLLKWNAPINLKDKRYGGTPLGWALHGWCYPPPERKNADYRKVAELLVAAGGRVERKNLDAAQTRKLKQDPAMRRILFMEGH
jgi:ankyrin repeat protein